MNQNRTAETSKLLTDLWKTGKKIEKLPTEFEPADKSDAYKIQQLVEGLSDQPLFGWKLAATGKGGQIHLGIDGPIAGRLLAERELPNHGSSSLKGNHMLVAEAEFAFKMGRDLSPQNQPYEVEDVMDAVATLHPAIEIPSTRYDRFSEVGPDQLIADNACAHQYIIGDGCDNWRDNDLVNHLVSGGTQKLKGEGTGANVLGDPALAMTWLANELAEIGCFLKAGEVVITGACFPPASIEPGDTFSADFGEFGQVSVSFTE